MEVYRNYEYIISLSAETVFIRQNLKSTDVRFWRMKTVLALKGLITICVWPGKVLIWGHPFISWALSPPRNHMTRHAKGPNCLSRTSHRPPKTYCCYVSGHARSAATVWALYPTGHTTLLHRWIKYIYVDSTSQQHRVPSGWEPEEYFGNWYIDMDPTFYIDYVSGRNVTRTQHPLLRLQVITCKSFKLI